MADFLELVAQDLVKKFGNDLSRLVVVFPNKRASLFLNEHLGKLSSQPLWAPSYITINQLFNSLGNLKINDPIDTVCRVQQHYAKATGDSVSLDYFYGWAERILSDFDDIDKNMVNAEKLFQNTKELREFEKIDFLNEEQKSVLQRFFKEFDPNRKSEIRERFSRLWNQLFTIYQSLNEELAKEGLAYEGAAFRNTVERLEKGEIELSAHIEKYVFVGFNVLDEVERHLFSYLKEQGKALFYWDYDKYYLPSEKDRLLHLINVGNALTARQSRQVPVEDAEAGYFLRKNLSDFPNELSEDNFDNLCNIETVEMVEASTESIQVQSVGQWLTNHLTPDAKRTAVVLCNESLLQPLLHTFPSNVKEVNVTKGFPLNHTAVSTLVESELGKMERDASTLSTVDALTKLLSAVGKEAESLVNETNFDTERFEHILQSEAYAQMNALLNRLLLIAQSGRLMVNPTTLRRILRQIVRQSVIPFAGEPAVGLQVMGVLETRCLDFDNIIMISVNEGALPQKSNDNSFIPYILRKTFGLTTPERKTAVYAYYFYRLIQRAKRLRLVYNSSSVGITTGEKSRFLTQLMVESQLPIHHIALSSETASQHDTPMSVKKPENLIELLKHNKNQESQEEKNNQENQEEQVEVRLSPSAINTYLRCQLRFYYETVLKIKQPEATDNEVQPNTLGSIFHDAAQRIYNDLRNQNVKDNNAYLTALQNDDKRLRSYIEAAFAELKVTSTPYLYNLIEIFVKSLLQFDAKHPQFSVLELEKYHWMKLPLSKGAPIDSLTIGGIIDRLDTIDEDSQKMLRIVDYKTGGDMEKAADLDEIFITEGDKQKHYMLQTFIYAAVLADEFNHNRLSQSQKSDTKLRLSHATLPIAPSLFFIHKLYKQNYSPYLLLENREVLNFREILDDFRTNLITLVEEILDPERTFEPTPNASKTNSVCSNCPYFSLCYQ